MQISIRDQIAIAIKDADKSYLFEDYIKQADHVLSELKAAGYKIIPAQASDKMVEAGRVAISFGAMRPADLVKAIYKAMVDSA